MTSVFSARNLPTLRETAEYLEATVQCLVRVSVVSAVHPALLCHQKD